jgi:aminomethyltransferase
MGGKIVDFHGWELPVQFTTITQEHMAVRERAGLFDISHMGQVFVWGPGAEAVLQELVTNDVRRATIGKGIYAHLLNERGGVIDDIFIYRVEQEKFLVIVNASRRAEDLAWMQKRAAGKNVAVVEATVGAALALQGPEAAGIVSRLSPPIADLPRFGIGEFQIGETKSLVARTGYTGEDGFEFFAPAPHLSVVFDAIVSCGTPRGMVPCGLGARDTLRTEVAYPLYGNELDEDHTPLEAGLGWVIRWDKGDFTGRAALEKQKNAGVKRKLAGFTVEAGGIARHGATVWSGGAEVGVVTSGTFSPSLSKAIGLAYVPLALAETGRKLQIRQGTREMSAVTVDLPFLKKPVAAKK